MTYQTTARVNRSPTATSPSRGWLTAVLRPAGTLDSASTAALGALLAGLSAAADMVVVDLDATRIPDLAAFVDALRPAAARLAGPGTCLLVVNAPSALEHALQIVDVPAATLAADPVFTPAQSQMVRPAASGRSGPRPPERSGPAAPGRAVAGRPPRPGRPRDRAAAP
jgi:hypothetical protein